MRVFICSTLQMVHFILLVYSDKVLRQLNTWRRRLVVVKTSGGARCRSAIRS